MKSARFPENIQIWGMKTEVFQNRGNFGDFSPRFLNEKFNPQINKIGAYFQFASFYSIIISATFTGVETLDWPWFGHRREHFLLIIVSKVGQTY